MNRGKTSSKTIQHSLQTGEQWSLKTEKERSSSESMTKEDSKDISEGEHDQESIEQGPSTVEPAPTVNIEGLRVELEMERQKSADYLRRLQYLQADFENFRKRTEREMSEIKRYGNDRLLSDLLVVVDELELGLHRAEQKGESPVLVEGIGMVLKRVQGLLAKEGVARIETKGAKFDPSIHEAALRTQSKEEEGTIVEEIRSGYTMKGRVLRPSIVKVSEGSRENGDNGQYNTEKVMEEEE